jgi:hypothetical protein
MQLTDCVMPTNWRRCLQECITKRAIITRLITRDQFSKFVLSNGVYNECTKLQKAFEASELFSTYDTFFLHRTLKNLIESYSKIPLADEDVSRFAQAMSYVILPGDMQAALRTSGAVNGAVLGISRYLQRNPSAQQFILSSLLQPRTDPCDVAPAQRVAYLPYTDTVHGYLRRGDTDTRKDTEVVACLLEKYTCFDPQHATGPHPQHATCFYRADRVKLLFRDLLFDIFAFTNRLRAYPDLPASEIQVRKKFYLDYLDALDSKELVGHYEFGLEMLRLDSKQYPTICNMKDWGIGE